AGMVQGVRGGLDIILPPQFTAAPGTTLINVTEAAAQKLHMASGWTVLTGDLKDVFTKYDVSWQTFESMTAVINIPAMLIILIVSTLLVIGIQESANVNSIIVMVKLAIVII